MLHYSSSTDRQKEEAQLLKAVASVLESGLRPGSHHYFLPISEAAREFGINHQKLRRRLSGIHNRSTAHVKQQTLTIAQEIILVEWIKSLARRAIPWTREIVREKAELISGKKVGVNWIYAFLKRHPDLSRRWTVGLESCRARALNRATVATFFDLLAELIQKYSIKPNNIYNMDEKGIQMGIGAQSRVLVDQNQKSIYMKVDGNQELVTLLECVCADGSALNPLAVFKGKRTNARWALINASKARYA